MSVSAAYLQSNKTLSGDECYTPFYVVDLVLEFLPKDRIIWLPFDEEFSAFYQKLKEAGHNVVRSHINDGLDFFEYEPEQWDIIVSNPPPHLVKKTKY